MVHCSEGTCIVEETQESGPQWTTIGKDLKRTRLICLWKRLRLWLLLLILSFLLSHVLALKQWRLCPAALTRGLFHCYQRANSSFLRLKILNLYTYSSLKDLISPKLLCCSSSLLTTKACRWCYYSGWNEYVSWGSAVGNKNNSEYFELCATEIHYKLTLNQKQNELHPSAPWDICQHKLAHTAVNYSHHRLSNTHMKAFFI